MLVLSIIIGVIPIKHSYTKMFSIKNTSKDNTNIKVELGDHNIFPVMYTQGKTPERNDEIALSVSNAKELNKKIEKVTHYMNCIGI